MPRVTSADFTEEDRRQLSAIMDRVQKRAGNRAGRSGRRSRSTDGGRSTERARARDRRTARRERRGPGGRFV